MLFKLSGTEEGIVKKAGKCYDFENVVVYDFL